MGVLNHTHILMGGVGSWALALRYSAPSLRDSAPPLKSDAAPLDKVYAVDMPKTVIIRPKKWWGLTSDLLCHPPPLL